MRFNLSLPIIDLVLAIHKQDLAEGFGGVYLPYALAKNILKHQQFLRPAPITN